MTYNTFKAMEGKTVGALFVVSFSHMTSNGAANWKVRCSCGREEVRSGQYLRETEHAACRQCTVKRTKEEAKANMLPCRCPDCRPDIPLDPNWLYNQRNFNQQTYAGADR